jgi:hypothetical protein
VPRLRAPIVKPVDVPPPPKFSHPVSTGDTWLPADQHVADRALTWIVIAIIIAAIVVGFLVYHAVYAGAMPW